MIQNEDFLTDEIYGERLLISVRADQTELNDNIRVARVVHNSKAVVVNADAFSAPDKETIKQLIKDVIERLRT